MGERQLGWLARVEGADLAGAFLEAAPGMSEARARGLAGFLRERAGRMLQIPPVGRDELADAAPPSSGRKTPSPSRMVCDKPPANEKVTRPSEESQGAVSCERCCSSPAPTRR